jgi:hypothetical protein
MAFEYEGSQTVRTYVADADLSAKQFYFVKRNTTTGKVSAITADTDVPWGVLLNKPNADGQPAQVCRRGLCKVSADVAISVGVAIGVSADGQATTRTIGTDTTKYVAGQSEEAATGANSLFAASINCVDPHRAA